MKKEWLYIILILIAVGGTVALISSSSPKTGSVAPSFEEQYDSLKKENATAALDTFVYQQPAALAVPAVDPAKGLSGKYAIQIASFSDRAKAVAVQQKAVENGLNAQVVLADLGEKGQFHRVYLGPFVTKEEASAVLAGAQASYKGSFIIVTK